jgi:hypothetical protein
MLIVPYVTNICAHPKRYRKHAVIHLEVNANVLNRFMFIVCHFGPDFPTINIILSLSLKHTVISV